MALRTCIGDVFHKQPYMKNPKNKKSASKPAGYVSFQAGNYIKAFSRLFPAKSGVAAKKMMRYSIEQFVESRNSRAQDMQSVEAKQAMEIENSLYPLGTPKIMLCVDGRVIAKFVASSHSGAIKTPAADSPEFLPDKDGQSLFLAEGNITRELRRLFLHTDTVSWILDSHLHCAARKTSIIESRGSVRDDDGLFEDVVRKRKIASALVDFVAREYGGAKRIDLMHVSFDPHSGYIFMGLEREEIMNDPRVIESGFTEAVLEELALEGKILSTKEWALVKSVFGKRFATVSFPVDYEKDYRSSTNRFWRHMKGFSKDLLVSSDKKVLGLYPSLEKDPMAVRQRAVLLVASAFTGFLSNMSENGYAYGEHDESIMAVTFGDRGPYDRMRSFTIDPGNPDISGVVRFVENLIRTNRTAGRMSDHEKKALVAAYGKKSAEYVWSPVPAVFFEHLTTAVKAEVILQIQSADWSDLVRIDWMKMDTEDFYRYLDSKVPGIPAVAAHRIDILRRHASRTFAPGLPAVTDMLEGRVSPLWMLRGTDRRIIAIFPFLAAGYREAK